MPECPEKLNGPSLKETVINLLNSIAAEEAAIAAVIKAEAKKIGAFLGVQNNFLTHPTHADITSFNQGIGRVLETILMEKWILLKKLETVMQFDWFDDSEEGEIGEE